MAEVTEQIIREAPEIEALKVGLIKSAKTLSEQSLGIPAYEAAGLSELQKQAMGLASQGIGSYAPFLQAGQGALEAGIGSLGQAQQTAAGINLAPQFNVAQQALEQGLGMIPSQANLGLSQGVLGQAASGLAGGIGAYNPAAAQTFMNPYQSAVTQQALGEMRRQADIARQGQAAQAIRAGAFGGTREGVQRAEFERGVQDVMGQRIMQDYAQNYAQAQQAAQQAFEAQQQRQLASSGQLAGIGGTLGQQALSQAQIGQAGAGLMGQLGQGIGSLAAQYGGMGLQQASTLGSLGQALGQSGLQQAQLGEAAQRMGLQDISLLSALGQTQQQSEQARLEAARATALQKALTPYQQLSFLSDIYKGAPGTQMALTAGTAPTTSPLLQAAGLGVAGLSAAAGASRAGLF
jgi:hypothetical protein